MAKLPKAQREFFDQFARIGVQNLLGPALSYKGVEINDEQLAAAVATLDLKELTEAIAAEFTSRVDFKTIKKVDAFMRGSEFHSVVQASTEVNRAINDLLVSVVAPLVPNDVPQGDA